MQVDIPFIKFSTNELKQKNHGDLIDLFYPFSNTYHKQTV